MTTQVPSPHREPPRDVEDGPAELQPAVKQHPAVKKRGAGTYVLGALAVVLGLMALLVIVAMRNSYENAKVNTAKIIIKNIEQGLHTYNAKVGQYPSQAEGLGALMQPPRDLKPFLKEVPKDPWGNEFRYFTPPRTGKRVFEVVSMGVDGELNTDDDLFSKAKVVQP